MPPVPIKARQGSISAFGHRENERNLSLMSAKNSSVLTLVDEKLERIHQYNIDARKVLDINKKVYNSQVRQKLETLVERDHRLMGYIPTDLCEKKL